MKRMFYHLAVILIISFAVIQAGAVNSIPQKIKLVQESQKVEKEAVNSVQSNKYFELFNLDERTDGKFYTMVDENGEIIMRTARHLHGGNSYITGDNKHFEVTRVVQDTAYAREIEKEQTSSFLFNDMIKSFQKKLPSFNIPTVFQRDNQENRLIGIYHSHGAESYVPSDGKESIDAGGGILRVGDVFASSLENLNIHTIHSKEPHVPQDSGAYLRSRRTAEEQLKKGPDAIFDVHRDAVPPEEYLVDDMVQIQLIVGGQNQNSANNRKFAEGLKAAADEQHPNLVKGILVASGSYNQDLTPRAMLMEVGAHENNREGAEKSIGLFADVVNSYVYGSASGREGTGLLRDTPKGPGGIAAGRALGLIVLAALGVGAYLLISTGSFEELKAKVKQFADTEFANYLGKFNLRGKSASGEQENESENSVELSGEADISGDSSDKTDESGE